MSDVISLSTGIVDPMGQIGADFAYADFNTLMLSPGSFNSMNGPVDITADDVRKLHDEYNKRLEETFVTDGPKKSRLSRIFHRSPNGADLSDVLGIQVRVDHASGKAREVIGRIKGKVWLMHAEDDKNIELWGNLRILGKENIIPIADTRMNNVSVTFNPENHFFVEVSFVDEGACLEARVEDSKLLHAVALSAKTPLDKQRNVTENSDIRLSLVSLLSKGIQEVDSQLSKLGQKSYVTKELRYLMAKGKILPKSFRAGLVDEVMSFSSEDRPRVLRLLDKLSPQVDTQMHLNNVNAIKGMEMLMSSDETVKNKLAEFFKGTGDLYKQMVGKSDGEKAAILAKAKQGKSAAAPVAQQAAAQLGARTEELNKEVDNDKSRYLAHFKELLAAGKHEELGKEIDEMCNNMAKGKEEDEEKERLAKEELSRGEKEKEEKEKEKLAAMKADFQVMLQDAFKASKEELVTLMNEALDKHNVVLAKFSEEHKDVISLAKAVATAASAETPTNQEK